MRGYTALTGARSRRPTPALDRDPKCLLAQKALKQLK